MIAMPRRIPILLVIPALLMAAAAGPAALADVTVEEKVAFDGFGAKGYGASDGTTTTVVSGDKMRQENVTRFTGKIMKRFSGGDGLKTAAITRIDRRVTYHVDFKDKSYTEVPFESAKDFQKELANAQASPEEKPPESPVTCDPIRVETNRTGAKEDIHGFASEEVVIAGTQVCRNAETGQACTQTYALDVWTTPETPALGDLAAFHARLAKAMGFDAREMEALAKAAAGAMKSMTQGLGESYKELSKVKGYPVRTRITIESEGSCTASDSTASEAPNMGDAVKGIGGSLKGMFGKKKESESQASKAKGGAAGAAKHKIFGMTSELLSVSSAAAPGDAFEPPTGFKKKDLAKN